METESLFSLVYFQFFANHFLREVNFDDVKAASHWSNIKNLIWKKYCQFQNSIFVWSYLEVFRDLLFTIVILRVYPCILGSPNKDGWWRWCQPIHFRLDLFICVHLVCINWKKEIRIILHFIMIKVNRKAALVFLNEFWAFLASKILSISSHSWKSIFIFLKNNQTCTYCRPYWKLNENNYYIFWMEFYISDHCGAGLTG